MKKSLIALLTAAAFALAVFSAAPVSALFGTTYVTPDGYCDNDYQKLVAFFETEDPFGVKNGVKLNEDYDPEDPSTWQTTVTYGEGGDQWEETLGVSWYYNGYLRSVQWIDLHQLDMYGTLDLSGCSRLTDVDIRDNHITAADFSGCERLFEIYCGSNGMTSLRLEGCVGLISVYCSDNAIGEIDVSGSPELINFDTFGNPLTSIDLSANPKLFLDRVYTEGEGRVWVSAAEDYCALHAQGTPFSVFVGWYNEAGGLISGDADIEGQAEWDDDWEHIVTPDPVTATGEKVWIARFVELDGLDADEYEVGKLRDFFEHEDDSGVKNGKKLNPAYDPDDISTWTTARRVRYDDDILGVIWCVDGGKAFVRSLELYDMGFTGGLDVNSFTHLEDVSCYYNLIDSIDVSDCPELFGVDCIENLLSSLDVRGCGMLTYLYVASNELSELDLSENPELEAVVIGENLLTEIDFSNNPYICIDRIYSSGGGCVAFEQLGDSAYVTAYPDPGCSFLGWYDQYGRLLTIESCFGGERIWDDDIGDYIGGTPIEELGETVWQARFVDENVLGFSEEDVAKLRDFFEQRDEDGVSNGAKLNPDYSPNDPSTWSAISYDDEEDPVRMGVTWMGYGDTRYACELNVSGMDMVGTLDLSGLTRLRFLGCENGRLTAVDVSDCWELDSLYCSENEIGSIGLAGCVCLWRLNCCDNRLTELDISECFNLETLVCSGNRLKELDLSDMDLLTYLACFDNELESIDISGCYWLEHLLCQNNRLTGLDLSDCSLRVLDCTNNRIASLDLSSSYELEELRCCDNLLKEIDLSSTGFFVDRITAIGGGSVGYYYSEGYLNNDIYVAAKPEPGYRFVGWFSPDGRQIASPTVFGGAEQLTWSDPDEDGWSYVIGRIPDPISQTGERVWIARFVEDTILPGDADGSGFIDTTDALIVLRCALSVDGDPEELTVYCDMDGNGFIDTADALIILRIALGIV